MVESTQTIKVDEDTWRDLNAMKNPGDSFADVTRRVVEFYRWKHPAWDGERPQSFDGD